jgi:anhydro-N-acetylmuramic acid kinase
LSTSHELGQLHHDLGRLYSEQAKLLRPHPSLVGLHGQTVFHNPDPRTPATLQIGEPAYLARSLGVPVINNFRAADIAAGGQGAPLATLFHRVVFAKKGAHVCVNNLGGISNVTSLDWRQGCEPQIVAFDTGPANVLMDLAARRLTGNRRSCDIDGSWARRGKVHERLLHEWLRHPYFKQSPPKSTGRELFGERFWEATWPTIRRAKLSNHDLLATLVEFTARSIATSYEAHLPSIPGKVILCGGGAKNPILLTRLTAALPTTTLVIPSDRVGWPADAIESAAFALLAYYRWRRKPGNLPATTGAKQAVLSGQITEP